MDYFSSKKNSLFFIAEIGGNHEGDFNYAKKLTKLSIESGADAVKFQIYSGNYLVSRIEDPLRNEHFKRFELNKDQYIYLADMCKEAGTIFMASVWDYERLKWVEKRLSLLKIGSGDLTAFPLIKKFVETGKPIILSTGLATIEEIRRTVDFIDEIDPEYIEQKKLALLQCTSSYPCPDQDLYLNAMLLLSDEFELPVGYSDHSIGNEAALAAATMGAKILEMHFTDSREGKEFRDHKVSITRDELVDLLEMIRRVKMIQGPRLKERALSEKESGHILSFRRSVYAKRDINKGERFRESNLTILRPEHGIPAHEFYSVIGCRSNTNIKKNQVLKYEYLDTQ